MQGLHLTADLVGCNTANAVMLQPPALRALCLQAVQQAGLQAVAELFHSFSPTPGTATAGGITGVVLLAESHLAVHTWPELAGVTLDVYVCNVSANHSTAAQALMDQLIAAFAPSRVSQQRLVRGALAS